MINLAGVEDCDKTIIAELLKVGVTAANVPDKTHPEVKSKYEGRLHGWKFSRQWYYWSIYCENAFEDGLDIKYASPMHALDHRNIRLAGHCGCPAPDDGFWMEKFDTEGKSLIKQKEWDECEEKSKTSDMYKDVFAKFQKEYMPVENPVEYAKKNGRLVASSYHIDSQEGLELFCWILNKQAADKKLAAEELEKILKTETLILKRLAILDYFIISGENPKGIFTCKKDESHEKMFIEKKYYNGHVIDFKIKCPCDGCGNYEWSQGNKVDEVVHLYESRTREE